jgi:hypothetical protein
MTGNYFPVPNPNPARNLPFTAKLFLMALLSLCTLAAAQNRQTIAIYMAGEEPAGAAGVHQVLGGELARTISQSENYSAVDRTEAILRQLTSEHRFQRSGMVSDEQIKSLGRQLGVNYLCIANISNIRRSYYLDVRLIDVVTAEILRTVTTSSNLRNVNEMIQVGQKIAYELIEIEQVRAQLRQEEIKREQRKRIMFTTAVGLDVLGAGLLGYGIYENSNRNSLINEYRFSDAEKAESRRNTALIVGGALLLTGISIHIFF